MAEISEGFIGTIRKRIVVVSTMERDVRIAFMSGLAAVAIAVALNLFSPLGPPVTTVVGRIPLGTLIALLLGEALILTFLATGLIETKRGWRYWLHGAIGLLLLVFLQANDFAPGAFALFIPLAMTFVFSVLRHRADWRRTRILQAATLCAGVTLAIAAIYLVTGEQVLVVSMVAVQAMIAMLGLLMASTDIAEIISVSSEALVSRFRGIIGHVPVLLVLALLSVAANIFISLSASSWSAREVARYLGSGLGLFFWLALTYGLVRLATRRRGPLDPHIRYGLLFLVVGAYFIALQAGIYWRLIEDSKSYDPEALFTYPEVFTIPILILLLSLLAMFTLGRRWPRMLASIVFAVWVGVLWFHYYASHGSNVVYLLDAVALGSLIWLGLAPWFATARTTYGVLCRLLADLNLSFALYAAVATAFFMAKGEGGALTLWQALIVLAALGWDIFTSGEAITNRHSFAFPRLARVCFFLSYVISVALLVLLSTSSELVLPSNGRNVEGVFESEPLVALGLVLFGPAFFLAMMTLRACNAFGKARSLVGPTAPTPEHADPTALPMAKTEEHMQ